MLCKEQTGTRNLVEVEGNSIWSSPCWSRNIQTGSLTLVHSLFFLKEKEKVWIVHQHLIRHIKSHAIETALSCLEAIFKSLKCSNGLLYNSMKPTAKIIYIQYVHSWLTLSCKIKNPIICNDVDEHGK